MDDFSPNAQSAIDLNIASTETQDCPIAPTVNDEFLDGNKLNEKMIHSIARSSQLKSAPNTVSSRIFFTIVDQEYYVLA